MIERKWITKYEALKDLPESNDSGLSCQLKIGKALEHLQEAYDSYGRDPFGYPEPHDYYVDWISVDERAPTEEERVLLYDKSEGICVGYRRADYFNHHPMGDHASCAVLFSITHWKPLPPPPESNHG